MAAGITRRRRIEPTHPTEGKMPILTYSYNAGAGSHRVECECGDFTETTEQLAARRFAQSHVGDHARLRIVTPIAELEAAE